MRLFSGIQRKIVLPFSCVFVIVFAVTALLSAHVVTRLQEDAVRKQANDVAQFVSEAHLPLSRALMERVKAVFGKEVAFYDARLNQVTSTLPESHGARLADLPAGTDRLSLDATTYRVFGTPVGKDGSRLFLLLPDGDLRGASAAASRPILILAVVGAAVTLALGVLITRTITGPLRGLSAKAEGIARTGTGHGGEPGASADEVGQLADAFRRMLVRLQESQQKLLEAEKLAAVGRVATGIAHEIRNPLASMKMNAQIIEEASPRDAAAGLIIKEIERLQMLIDELLYYSRPMPLRTEPASFNDAIDGSLAVLGPRLAHARVEVRREYDAALPPVKLDRARFKQVAINLILNAMQAMPGGGTLVVRSMRDRECVSGEMLVAEFDDTGCGIPPGIDSDIFAPFFSTREGGIGIGLAVSRKIVEEHGGKIDFRRKPQGTIFRVHLPA